ncbi:MAG: NAD(P)/FAD-dependent oxidoreductase [Chloroflexi bacterium]|nr:NAD(P)/FAD-dependent oxidoreductase [Chloroflexota bacterium]
MRFADPRGSAEHPRDAIVVGGGPAGAVTAMLLAESGHDVLLLERAAAPRLRACSEYTGPGTENMLRRLGLLRLVENGIGRRIAAMTIQAPNGARHDLRYDEGCAARAALSLRRPALDAALLDEARRRGVEVRTGFQVRTLLTQEPPGPMPDSLRPLTVCGVMGRDADGNLHTLHARLVVGADGRHSLVASALGLRTRSHWPGRLGLVAHFRDVPWRDGNGWMLVGRHGYVGAAPRADGLLTVGLVRPLPRSPLGPAAAAFDAALMDYPALSARLVGGRRVGQVLGVGPLAGGVKAVGGNGFLLVGDAAGFRDPFTGEGIYRALRGAEIAAQAAAHALAGGGQEVAWVGPEYARARRAAFATKERLTGLVQVFLRAPNLMSYAVRRLNARPALARRLANALGDLEPAGPLLRAGFIGALLSPV